MQIIDEYKKLTEDTAVVKSKLATTNRGIKKFLAKNCPSDAQGIDYTKDRVQSSLQIPNIHELEELIEQMQELESDLKELYEQRDELEQTINDLGDLKKQVVMLQIKGYTQLQIAKALSYSKSYIEKICSQNKKECGKSAVYIEKIM